MAFSLLHKLSPFHTIDRYVNSLFKRNGLKKNLLLTDTYTIDYWDTNSEKPPLLLLPAFAADTKYSWFRQVHVLTKHYRLIVPNLLYFGKSTMNPKKFGIQNQVEAMHTLLEHLNIQTLTICSASYGAIVAAELIHQKKINVQKLVMTNAPFVMDQGAKYDLVTQKFRIQSRSDLLVPANGGELKRLFNLTYYRKPLIPNLVFRDLYKYLYAGKTADKKNLIDTCVEELELLKMRNYNFTFPILLLWGTHDILVSQDSAHELKKRLGNFTRVQLIEKTAHMPNFERPRTYNKYLIQFLVDEKPVD